MPFSGTICHVFLANLKLNIHSLKEVLIFLILLTVRGDGGRGGQYGQADCRIYVFLTTSLRDALRDQNACFFFIKFINGL